MKLRFFTLIFSILAFAGFAQEPDADFVLPPFTAEYDATRSLAQTVDYWHPLMESDQAWNRTRGAGAVVFILDTGQNPHPDLSQNGQQYNFNTTTEAIADGNGHGSYCAGVIAAQDNTYGALGIAPDAIIVSGKVMRNNGTGSNTEIAQGIRRAADVYTANFSSYVGIISMSFGGGSPMPDVEEALLYAQSKGMVLVASAGNSGFPGTGNTMGWPARYDFVISVAAIAQNLTPAPFSSGGDGLDCTAFGVSIYSTNNNGGYARVSGTSFSGPMVAGVCALIGSYHKTALLSGDRTKINERVQEHIRKYSTDLVGTGYGAGWDSRTGYGIPKATGLDKVIPGGGGTTPPDPPTRDARNINVTVPDSYTMLWRPENSEQFNTLNIKFEVKHNSKKNALPAHQDAVAWVAGFFFQRGFILMANDDEWEALFWARHFTEVISKVQGVPLVCMRLTATTEGGQVFTLSDNERRQGATAKVKAGVKRGVMTVSFAGE